MAIAGKNAKLQSICTFYVSTSATPSFIKHQSLVTVSISKWLTLRRLDCKLTIIEHAWDRSDGAWSKLDRRIFGQVQLLIDRPCAKSFTKSLHKQDSGVDDAVIKSSSGQWHSHRWLQGGPQSYVDCEPKPTPNRKTAPAVWLLYEKWAASMRASWAIYALGRSASRTTQWANHA